MFQNGRLVLLARVRLLVRLKRFADEFENAESALSLLARSMEAKVPYTEGHCDRLPRGICNDLRRSGIVPDMGIAAEPESILLKPGRLNTDDRRTKQEYTTIGDRNCAPLKFFRSVLPIIRGITKKRMGAVTPAV